MIKNIKKTFSGTPYREIAFKRLRAGDPAPEPALLRDPAWEPALARPLLGDGEDSRPDSAFSWRCRSRANSRCRLASASFCSRSSITCRIMG